MPESGKMGGAVSKVRRSAILVAGMHRSGTSALTRVLSLSGADLPEKLLPPMNGVNERGFWESEILVDLHEGLLKTAGSFWADWSELSADWYQSPLAEAYRDLLKQFLIDDFSDSSLFVIKEPRLCRFMPLWLDVLDELCIEPVVVIPLRHPLEVADSLKRRDGMPVQQSVLLWLRHVLDAIYYAVDMKCAFVSYDNLLTDWSATIDAITKQTGLFFPRRSPATVIEIEKYIDRRYRNSRIDSFPVDKDGLYSLAETVYETVLQLVNFKGDRDELLIGLLEVRAEFNKTSSWHVSLFLSQEEQKLQLKTDLVHSCAERDEGRYALEEAQKTQRNVVAELDSERTYLRVERDELSRALEEAVAVQSGLRGELNEASVALEEAVAVQSGLRKELDSERDELNRALEEAVAVQSGLREELSEASVALEEAVAVQSGLRGELSEASVALEEAVAVQSGLREEAEQLRLTLQQSQAQLLNVQGQFDDSQRGLGYANILVEYYRSVSANFESNINPQLKQAIVNETQVSDRYRGLAGQPFSVSDWWQSRKKRLYCLEKMSDSQLFDEVFYLQHYPDAKTYVHGSIAHYLDVGAALAYDPNPLFSTAWYLTLNKDVCDAGENPLVHFVLHGAEEGRSCHPLFDARWYLESNEDVRKSKINPLYHYLRYGYKERRSPCILLDASWYSSKYTLTSEMNPCVHFLQVGASRDYCPHPLFSTDFVKKQCALIGSGEDNPLIFYLRYGVMWRIDPHPLFDSNFYAQQVQTFGFTPALLDFLMIGVYQGKSPSPLFDLSWYLSVYPEVEKSGINPLIHYLEQGASLGYKPNPLFDTVWYQHEYGDLLNGVEPLTDYTLDGWKCGRNPNKWFDSQWYLDQNPVLSVQNINPLSHYLLIGAKVGANTHPDIDLGEYLESYPDMSDSILTPLGYYLECIEREIG